MTETFHISHMTHKFDPIVSSISEDRDPDKKLEDLVRKHDACKEFVQFSRDKIDEMEKNESIYKMEEIESDIFSFLKSIKNTKTIRLTTKTRIDHLITKIFHAIHEELQGLKRDLEKRESRNKTTEQLWSYDNRPADWKYYRLNQRSVLRKRYFGLENRINRLHKMIKTVYPHPNDRYPSFLLYYTTRDNRLIIHISTDLTIKNLKSTLHALNPKFPGSVRRQQIKRFFYLFWKRLEFF